MPDFTHPPPPASTPPAAPAPDASRARSYFNQNQTEYLSLADSVLAAIQHAADALWPASDEANRPIRKPFAIPLNRAMGL